MMSGRSTPFVNSCVVEYIPHDLIRSRIRTLKHIVVLFSSIVFGLEVDTKACDLARGPWRWRLLPLCLLVGVVTLPWLCVTRHEMNV